MCLGRWRGFSWAPRTTTIDFSANTNAPPIVQLPNFILSRCHRHGYLIISIKFIVNEAVEGLRKHSGKEWSRLAKRFPTVAPRMDPRLSKRIRSQRATPAMEGKCDAPSNRANERTRKEDNAPIHTPTTPTTNKSDGAFNWQYKLMSMPIRSWSTRRLIAVCSSVCQGKDPT
jgi:hypothetical protein